MPDFGLFVTLPMESVAVRATVGSLIGLVGVAVLLRGGLRVPRVRTVAVVVPVVALITAVVVSWGELLLPVIMTVTQADNALPVPLGKVYLEFAPIGWPIFIGLWTAVVGVRVGRRVMIMTRMRHVARAGAPSRDFRVQRLTQRLSRQLGLRPPRVAVVDGCPGGAVVVGVRQPTLVVDAELLDDLDDEELEGLLAHEFAHIRRRDNLLALLVGLIRDMFFFVPGGRWVARRLCTERELAADQLAVETTVRPGALASGLLKVIDVHRSPSAACSAFAAPAAVVTRVERLVADQPATGRWRTTAETLGVAAVLILAVASSIQLPAAVADHAGEDGALAFLWASHGPQASSSAESVAFDVYHSSSAITPDVPAAGGEVLEPGREFTPAVLRGHRPATVVPPGRVSTQLERRHLEDNLLEGMRATPLVAADEQGVGVYWLRRHRERPR